MQYTLTRVGNHISVPLPLERSGINYNISPSPIFLQQKRERIFLLPAACQGVLVLSVYFFSYCLRFPFRPHVNRGPRRRRLQGTLRPVAREATAREAGMRTDLAGFFGGYAGKSTVFAVDH